MKKKITRKQKLLDKLIPLDFWTFLAEFFLPAIQNVLKWVQHEKDNLSPQLFSLQKLKTDPIIDKT